MKNDKGKVAVIYCRVSTEDQKDNGTSLESQESYCLEYAKQQGWKVLRVVKEDASGTWPDRPKFASVRADIRARKANILLCYVADRMSRHQTHSLVFFDEVCESGAELWFAQMGSKIEDSPFGRAMLSLLATGAAMEHANILRRTMEGKRDRIKIKKKLHGYGIPMYGYKFEFEQEADERGIHHKTGRRVINEVEAAVVRKIYEMRAGGASYWTITSYLVDAGIPSPTVGKRKSKKHPGKVPQWATATIWHMLREPAYKGVTIDWRYKVEKRRNDEGKPIRVFTRRNDSVQLPEGTTPAIVSAELWEAANAKGTARFKGSNRKVPALFRGCMFCGVCGRPMHVCHDHTLKHKLHYRCATYASVAATRCGNSRVKEHEAEAFAWPIIAGIIKDPDVITRAIQNLKDEETDSQLEFDLQSLKSGLVRCEKDIQSLIKRMATFADDDYLSAGIEQQLRTKKTDRDQYLAMIADLERRVAANLKQAVDLTDLQEYCEQVRDVVDDFGFEEKRLAVEALRVKLYFTKGEGPEGRPNMRLDVPIAVKEAIGYGVHAGLLKGESVAALRTW